MFTTIISTIVVIIIMITIVIPHYYHYRYYYYYLYDLYYLYYYYYYYYYTRSPSQDFRLFGPRPWKILATTYDKNRFLSNPDPGEIF